MYEGIFLPKGIDLSVDGDLQGAAFAAAAAPALEGIFHELHPDREPYQIGAIRLPQGISISAGKWELAQRRLAEAAKNAFIRWRSSECPETSNYDAALYILATDILVSVPATSSSSALTMRCLLPHERPFELQSVSDFVTKLRDKPKDVVADCCYHTAEAGDWSILGMLLQCMAACEPSMREEVCFRIRHGLPA